MVRNGAKRASLLLGAATAAVVLSLYLPLSPALAQEAAPIPIPRIGIEVGTAETPQQVMTAFQVFFLVTVLALAPAILVMMTSFTRIIVVLGFLRQALATQQMPPNQVLVGLALFLTFFVMAPTWQQINVEAFQPYMAQEISQGEAFDRALTPLREFMFRQTRERDVMLLVTLSEIERPNTIDDVPTHVLIPAFVISELRTAFEIGFMLYIPFLIIDMVVASTLMSMGMFMLPPIFISLPFKVIMFVLADGWNRLVGSLIMSFAR
jgi:flagellar biosynthetic protein FliP